MDEGLRKELEEKGFVLQGSWINCPAKNIACLAKITPSGNMELHYEIAFPPISEEGLTHLEKAAELKEIFIKHEARFYIREEDSIEGLKEVLKNYSQRITKLIPKIYG